MMYQNKVAAAIKVNGKILREQGDLVVLPFGSEYSILIKNLNSVRIQVKVSVDGQDATSGNWLVINPNTSLELERFITNGNFNSGNRFKFIERTAQIEQHRGSKVDDGLIRIEYQTEQKVEVETIKHIVHEEWTKPWPKPWWEGKREGRRWNDRKPMHPTRSSGPIRSSGISGQSQNSDYTVYSSFTSDAVPTTDTTVSCFAGAGAAAAGAANTSGPSIQLNDIGITVPGSLSNQQFCWVDGFPTTGVTEVLIFHLKGRIGGKEVAKPITVAQKPECKTCGKTNKATSKFCAECGTALELV